MKYTVLTKEQFEALHFEFSQFLAAQKIDKKTWEQLKKENAPKVTEQLEIFSDIVWEDVLTKTRFITHYSAQNLELFKCGDAFLRRISIKVQMPEKDLRTQEGISWLFTHLKSPFVKCFSGYKTYGNIRNKMLFDLIKKGGTITDKKLYQIVENIISSK